MESIPTHPGDLGHYDISKYTMEYILFLDVNLSIKFLETNNKNKGFIIVLDKIVAFNSWIKDNKFSLFRVDNGGSSFGLDIASRLNQPDIKEYMVLYLFEDEKHINFVFRGLANKISITHF